MLTSAQRILTERNIKSHQILIIELKNTVTENFNREVQQKSRSSWIKDSASWEQDSGIHQLEEQKDQRIKIAFMGFMEHHQMGQKLHSNSPIRKREKGP